MKSRVPHAASFLFVPANRADRYAKALASPADMVILDLEDAVSPQDKDAARQALVQGVTTLPPQDRQRLLVRINPVGTPWHAEDLQAVREAIRQGIPGVVLPKAEDPSEVAAVADALGPQAALLPLIESLRGLDHLPGLACAPQVVRLAFGHLDFQLDLGMRCDKDEAELLSVRIELVKASRRADLAAPVDGVTIDVTNPDQLAHDLGRSKRIGFSGKLCIHPTQVAAVNAAFQPSEQELDWARRVLEQAASGVGVFQVDGKMVDAPVIASARRLLERQAAPSA